MSRTLMYTKLYSTILDSSIWGSSDATRIVWITMLAMATRNGIVHASVDGLARRANIHLEATVKALEELAAPDPNDKSGVQDGRRILPMQGCWQLINFEFYREAKSIDAVRKQQWRDRKGHVLDKDPSSRSAPAPAPEEEILSSPAAPAPDAMAVVRDVFTTWQQVHSHPGAKLDAKRTARIRSALKLRGACELKQAIRGALKDNWLMGRDPKSPRKYDGLETILRDTAQIERLIDLETGKTKAGGYRPTAAGASRQTDEGVDPWAFHDKTRK